jgi:uncharacterized membrane protein YbhN (UPF0104 family)
MSDRARQIAKLLLRASVAAVLLLWVFRQVDLEQFRRTATTARWDFLVGVWLLTVLFSSLQAYTLQLALRRQGCEVNLRTLLAATCVTAFYSLFLPGILSTGIKWYILKRSTGKGTNVLSSMLYNQVTLSIVMLVIGLAGLILVNPADILLPGVPGWVLPTISGGMMAIIVLLSMLAVSERTGGVVVRLLTVYLRALPPAARGKGREMLTQVAIFQTAGWRFHSIVALVNLVDALVIGVAMYVFAARAAHVIAPVGVLISLCAIVFVLGKIPVSVANLGVREVTLVGLLGLYGVDKAGALLMSMVMFSGLVFLAALGGAYQLYWSLTKR